MSRKVASKSATHAPPLPNAAMIVRLEQIKALAHDLGVENGPATLHIANEIVANIDVVLRLLKR